MALGSRFAARWTGSTVLGSGTSQVHFTERGRDQKTNSRPRALKGETREIVHALNDQARGPLEGEASSRPRLVPPTYEFIRRPSWNILAGSQHRSISKWLTRRLDLRDAESPRLGIPAEDVQEGRRMEFVVGGTSRGVSLLAFQRAASWSFRAGTISRVSPFSAAGRECLLGLAAFGKVDLGIPEPSTVLQSTEQQTDCQGHSHSVPRSLHGCAGHCCFPLETELDLCDVPLQLNSS